MRFATIETTDGEALCIVDFAGNLVGRLTTDPGYPGSLIDLIRSGALDQAAANLSQGHIFREERIRFLPPIPNPEKIICVGLNYLDHATESGHAAPQFPTLFARFNSSLTGHATPVAVPHESNALDFECEMVAIIGKAGRRIAEDKALDHVIGYSLFNDISLRDYQSKTTQWTMGKNFDGTGVFGPHFVTADEVPPGGRGLRIETRLNGEVMQSASTDSMIFSVAQLISIISAAITLVPGDVIVTGTPSGVGMARTPPLWMKPGDICDVTLEGIGALRTPITVPG